MSNLDVNRCNGTERNLVAFRVNKIHRLSIRNILRIAIVFIGGHRCSWRRSDDVMIRIDRVR